MTAPTPDAPGTSRTVRPVTPDRWPDLEAFCGSNGLYGNCWCMWWRRTAADFATGVRGRGRGNREQLRRLTLDGTVPGLLAYERGRPVGWVSTGPRERFGRILRSPHLRPDPGTGGDGADRHTWSVVCFYVPRPERGRGTSRALLDAAVSFAADQGAETVEGYPVDTDRRPSTPDELYTGTLGLFRAAGFHEARHRGGRRHVVQLHTAPTGAAGSRRREP